MPIPCLKQKTKNEQTKKFLKFHIANGPLSTLYGSTHSKISLEYATLYFVLMNKLVPKWFLCLG